MSNGLTNTAQPHAIASVSEEFGTPVLDITTRPQIQIRGFAIERLPADHRVSMHWSGCPAGCGNHAAADVGLLGQNIRVGDDLVDAVDVFVGGRMGPDPKPALKVLEAVPCSDLPRVLDGILPYVGARTRGHARA